MATEAQKDEKKPPTLDTASAVVTTSAVVEDVTTDAKAKADAKESKADAKAEPAPKTEARKAKQLDDDDDIPENEDRFELSKEALQRRLRRYSKAELKREFGTDDPAVIKARLEKAEALEKKEEEARRAALDEKARLQEDLNKERARAVAAEEKMAALALDHAVDRTQQTIEGVVKSMIDPDYIESELVIYANYLQREYKPNELKKLGPSDFKKYFEKRLKDKPKLARDDAPTEAKEAKKVGLTNGAGGDSPPEKKDTGAKTFEPGKPNSMSREEARAEARRQGYDL